RMDRPGLGGTPWPGVLPRLADEVATLAELIDRLGTSVVVAHSMAGLHAEALARLHPDRVAGLVLVDSSVEWSPKPPSGDAVWLTAARSVRAVMRVPVFRPLGSLADRLLTSAQSRRRVFDAVTPEAKEVYRSRDAVASVVAEQAAYGQQVLDLAALRATTPLPELPVTVLTAAADGGASWVDDQRRLADLLGGTQLVAEDSRHLIMIDRPDLVAAAVRTVRERATNREVPDD
ncbi:MAG: alpha/beta hydrolase, partial [Propionibacteriaceae bacterium]